MVVRMPDSHLSACWRAGGCPDDPDVAGRPLHGGRSVLRWPGYLGANYSGVLLVGEVHTGFTRVQGSARRRALEPVEEGLIAANRTWLLADPNDRAADRAYLEATRRWFIEGARWWPRMSRFTCVLEYAGLDWSCVAYTNVAKCQVPGPNRTGVVDACIKAGLTLDVVIDAVEPVGVLACIKQARRDFTPWSTGGGPYLHCFEGLLRRNAEGRSDDEWMPEVGRRLRALVDTGAYGSASRRHGC